MPLPIEAYALIGNCHTAALVGRDGSIDWLCWPRFDSPACFAALLGNADNGRWIIAPSTFGFSMTRRYHPGTLVLETEFETGGGRAAIIDFMPPGNGGHLVRIWLVDNYILQGRRAEARKLFERLLSRCNDVGLLAEEFDPVSSRMLGNFPQAYSHVGLINCALNLTRQEGPAEERAEL